MSCPFVFAASRAKRVVKVRFRGDPSIVAVATHKLVGREGQTSRMRVSLLTSGVEVGYMILQRSRVTSMQALCRYDVDDLRPDWHGKFDEVSLYKVHYSEVFERGHRNKGYGLLMYVAALVFAASQGTGIASDECFWGSTSRDAGRVWRSSRFARVANVSGQVAFLKGAAA